MTTTLPPPLIDRLKVRFAKGDFDLTDIPEEPEPFPILVWRDVANQILEQDFPQAFEEEVWERFDQEVRERALGIDGDLWETYKFLLVDAAETVRTGIEMSLHQVLTQGEAEIGERFYASSNLRTLSEPHH